MPRDYKVSLEDILDAIRKIRTYTTGLTLQTFRQDPKTFDAVVRNLEIIGEAVKRLPEGARAQHPEIDWKRVGRLRDILIHEYFGVDAEIIWDVVENKLGTLETAVQNILKE
ncbi:MAG: DUF86 domain-containing protein [Terriglobia bacterium]